MGHPSFKISIGLALLGGASLSYICYYLYTRFYQHRQIEEAPGVATLAQNFISNDSKSKRYDMNIPFYAIDLLVGPKEKNLRNIERESDACIKLQKYNREDFVRKASMLKKNLCLTISGSPSAVTYASSRIKEKLAEINIIEVELASSKVRLIIGKSGNSIRRIREASGAQILISDDEQDHLNSMHSQDLLINSTKLSSPHKIVYIYGYLKQTSLAQELITNMFNSGTFEKFQSISKPKRNKVDVSTSSHTENSDEVDLTINLNSKFPETVSLDQLLSIYHGCKIKPRPMVDDPFVPMVFFSKIVEYNLCWFSPLSLEDDRNDLHGLLNSFYAMENPDFLPSPVSLQEPGELCVVYINNEVPQYGENLLERAALVHSCSTKNECILLLLETGNLIYAPNGRCFEFHESLYEFPIYIYPCVLDSDSKKSVDSITLATSDEIDTNRSILISNTSPDFLHRHDEDNDNDDDSESSDCSPVSKDRFNCEILASSLEINFPYIKLGSLEPLRLNNYPVTQIIPEASFVNGTVDLLGLDLDSPIQTSSNNSILSPEQFFSAHEDSSQFDLQNSIYFTEIENSNTLQPVKSIKQNSKISSPTTNNEENTAFLDHLKNTFNIPDKPSNPMGLPKTPLNSVSNNLSVNEFDGLNSQSFTGSDYLEVNGKLSLNPTFESHNNFPNSSSSGSLSSIDENKSEQGKISGNKLEASDLENSQKLEKDEVSATSLSIDSLSESKSTNRSSKARKRRDSAKKRQ